MEVHNDLQKKVAVFMVALGCIICVLAYDYVLAGNNMGNRKARCRSILSESKAGAQCKHHRV